MVTLVIFLLFASVIQAQDIIYEKEDDTCTLPDGKNGICKENRLCPEAYANFPRIVPVTCGFKGKQPIVCCSVRTDRVTKKPDDIVPIQDISAPAVDFTCGDSNPSVVESTNFDASRFSRSSDNIGLKLDGIFNAPIKIEAVGGEPARFVLVKYSVIAGSRDATGALEWFCTAVLINHRWVLTAAHCVVARPITVIRLGEHDFSDPFDGANPQDYDVIESVLHPEYIQAQGYHDLALLKLASHVTFGEFINPVCLPWGTGSQRELTNQKISLTGWGATEFGGSFSPVLQEVNVTVFDNSVCERSYSDLRNYNEVWPRGITKDILCAGDPQGGKDACQGDSGGPVVYLNEIRQYVLAGVVSRGYGCGLKEFPGLYANIHHPPYLAWIKNMAFQ